jgi:hypothetical protein
MYCITVQGYVSKRWSDLLSDLTVITKLDDSQRPVTTLIGELADQAMLLGVLNYIYDLSLPLIEVQRLDKGEDVSEDRSRRGATDTHQDAQDAEAGEK